MSDAPDQILDGEMAQLRALIVKAGNALATLGPGGAREQDYEDSVEVYWAQTGIKKLIAAQSARVVHLFKKVGP